MNEFEFIQSQLAGLAGPEGLDLQDDVALWSPPGGQDVVISTDTIVEGVHFPQGKFDAQLAQKLIRVNVSDIVAKGADPLGYSLSLSLNADVSSENLKSFCHGLAQDQNEYGVKLWGGDTTRTSGPNVLMINIIGTVPLGKMVSRSGAQADDILYLLGPIGDAYVGLKVLQKQSCSRLSEAESSYLAESYHVPKPPFEMRHLIRRFANAAIDVSDGLIADAGHIADASNVRLDIMLAQIPTSEAVASWLALQADALKSRIALATGGDDYTVLMSVGAQNADKLEAEANSLGYKINKIGLVSSGKDVRVLTKDGDLIPIENPGYTHF